MAGPQAADGLGCLSNWEQTGRQGRARPANNAEAACARCRRVSPHVPMAFCRAPGLGQRARRPPSPQHVEGERNRGASDAHEPRHRRLCHASGPPQPGDETPAIPPPHTQVTPPHPRTGHHLEPPGQSCRPRLLSGPQSSPVSPSSPPGHQKPPDPGHTCHCADSRAGLPPSSWRVSSMGTDGHAPSSAGWPWGFRDTHFLPPARVPSHRGPASLLPWLVSPSA